MTKKGGTVGPICPPGQMYDPLAGKCMPKPNAPEGYFPKKKKKLFKGAGKKLCSLLKDIKKAVTLLQGEINGLFFTK